MVTHAQVPGFQMWTYWGPYFPAERGPPAHSERRSALLTQCVLGAGHAQVSCMKPRFRGDPLPPPGDPSRRRLPGRGWAAGTRAGLACGREEPARGSVTMSRGCGHSAAPPPPPPMVIRGSLAGLRAWQALPLQPPPGRAFPELWCPHRPDGGQGATSQKARPSGFGPSTGLEPVQRLQQTRLEGQR